jgi:hypothetical protein
MIGRVPDCASVSSITRMMPVSGARTVAANSAPIAARANTAGGMLSAGATIEIEAAPQMVPRASIGAKMPPGNPTA